MFRRNRKEFTYEAINQWQAELLSCMGINASTDPEIIKEICRKVLLETSNLYENMLMLEAGLKPCLKKKRK